MFKVVCYTRETFNVDKPHVAQVTSTANYTLKSFMSHN